MRHALRNSVLPVITIMALQVAALLSGAVITESVFGIPGIGRISVGAITEPRFSLAARRRDLNCRPGGHRQFGRRPFLFLFGPAHSSRS